MLQGTIVLAIVALTTLVAAAPGLAAEGKRGGTQRVAYGNDVRSFARW